MNHIIQMALFALGLAALCAWLYVRRLTKHDGIAANALGVNEFQEGFMTLVADDGTIVTRYSLVKFGSDNFHMTLAGAGDEPIGICIDTPVALDPNGGMVRLLGGVKGALTGIAAGAIAAGADVYAAANGQLQAEPGAAGTYWLVGRATGVAVNAGDTISFVGCKPVKLVVLAALTSAQAGAAPTQAQFNALQADVAALAAAMATPCLVKHL